MAEASAPVSPRFEQRQLVRVVALLKSAKQAVLAQQWTVPAWIRPARELAQEPAPHVCTELVQEVPVGASAEFVGRASQGQVSTEAESAHVLASTSDGAWAGPAQLAVRRPAGSVRDEPEALVWSSSGTAQNLASAAAATWPQSWVGPVRMDTTVV